jgi:hypothetical protein
VPHIMKGEETLKFLPSPFTQPEVLPQKKQLITRAEERSHTLLFLQDS